LLQRRRAREAAGSVHVHEPSSLLTFDLMGIHMGMPMDISMWVSMDIHMWVSIDVSMWVSMEISI
jgi:hypothetical protein